MTTSHPKDRVQKISEMLSVTNLPQIMKNSQHNIGTMKQTTVTQF